MFKRSSPVLLVALMFAIVGSVFVFVPARKILAAGATFYVATNGNDSWTGTLAAPNGTNTDGPFRTIQRAATAAQAGDAVQVRAGTYRETVTPPNSGTAGAPVVFKNYPGETATVSGADLVSGSWAAVGNGVYSLGSVGGFTSSLNQAEQVFVDGRMMQYARIPNTGLDVLRTTKFEADSGTPWANVTVLTRDASNNPVMIRTTLYDSDLTQNATDYYKGMLIAVTPEVSYQFVTGTVVASAQGSITIEYNHAASGLATSVTKGDAYYLFGKPQGVATAAVVDNRGEWYRDTAANTLYLRTPANDSPANHTVEVKQRDYAFNLHNRSYITIQGLNIFAATITTDTEAGDGANGANGVGVRQGYDNIAPANHIVIDGITGRYLSHFTDQTAFVYTQWANNTGIILSGSDNELKNSVLEFSAGNGVSVTGVRAKITNNIIHDVVYSGCECAAIMTGFNNTASRDHDIGYNTAYNSGKNLVLFRNLENTSATNPLARIHHNDFSNAAVAGVQDTGVLYTWSDAGRDLKGIEIDHNLLHDAYDEVAGVAIYLDGSISGLRIHHNVAWNSGGMLTGGANNLLYNNTINGAFGSNNGTNENTLIRNTITSDISAFNTASWQASDNLLPPVDGQFCAPAAGNFALRASSPARNTGVALPPYTDGSLESAPDKGAYEFDPANPCVPNWTAGSSLALPTPAAPSNLAAVVGTGRVDLTWTDNATNEQAYYVERNDGGYIWRIMAVLPANSTHYADTSLLGGSYRYRVRADNSPYSVLITVGAGRSALGRTLVNSFDSYGGTINNFGGQGGTVGGLDVGDWLKYSSVNFPSGITSLSAIISSWATCNSSCHIEYWQDALPASLGGSGGYKIADIAVNWTLPDFSAYAENTTTVSTGYRTGIHDLYVTVTGNSLGNFQSFQFSQGASVPNAPGGLATSTGNGQITLTWADNATNEDLYKIERSQNQLDWVQVAALPANTTSYIDGGLNSNTEYSYRVRAYNSQGNSGYSAVAATPTSANAGVPVTPIQLTASAIDAGVIQVRWYDTSLNETSFSVDRATDAAFTSGLTTQNLGANTTTLAASGLAANTTYFFRVRATNGTGSSANSATVSVVTPNSTPTAPGTPVVKALSSQRMLLTWQDVSVNESEFAIERSPDGTNNWAELGRVGAGATQYIDGGLAADTQYFYRVRALNAAGGTASSAASARTLTRRVGINTQLEAETFDTSSTNNNVASVDRGASVGSFDQYDWIMLRDVDFSGGTNAVVASVATGASGKQLEVRIDERLGPLVATLNVPNTGSFGSFQSVSTAPSLSPIGTHDVYLISKNAGAFNLDWVRFDSTNSVPVAPSTVRAAATSSGTTMQVTWTDNANNESGFTIERNTTSDEAAGGWTQAGTVAANITSFTDSGLTAGTTYSYRVKATNSYGSSLYNSSSGDRIWRATTRTGHALNVVIQAEAYQSQSGGVNNWLYGLSGLDDGDWAMYSDVNLAGANQISLNIATPNAGKTIEVRIGSPTGTLLGTLTTASTGDYGTYAQQTATLIGASGSADVYLIFKGGYGIANLDALTFNGTAATATPTSPPTATPTIVPTTAPTSVPTATPTSMSTATPSSGLPAPWQSQNIGTVGVAGSATYSAGTFTVQASGDDIWNNADAFRYVYQPLNGDGQIVARVTSLGNTNVWAKAGVMIRDTLNAGAKNALMAVSASNGTTFQWRATTSGSSSYSGSTDSAPIWVKLVRSGSTFTGYKSTNGNAWTQVGSTTISMGTTVYVGLAVTSHNNGTLTTATFSNVSTAGTRVYAITAVGSTAIGSYTAGSPYLTVTSGYGFSSSNAVDTSAVINPAPQGVYQSPMNGNFTYTLPNLTPGGSYKVRLHFAEVYHNSSGARVFNVAINGTNVLANFDIFAAAGAKDKAIVREFNTTANSSGAIVIVYTTVTDNSQSNGVEVLAN